ncbi:hypothetical protein C2S51_003401 [Perilla frutescens var. frutescens]|nr:hypothetical protein C2S51_003401 [Perilla frutescens var. frutescens]
MLIPRIDLTGTGTTSPVLVNESSSPIHVDPEELEDMVGAAPVDPIQIAGLEDLPPSRKMPPPEELRRSDHLRPSVWRKGLV